MDASLHPRGTCFYLFYVFILLRNESAKEGLSKEKKNERENRKSKMRMGKCQWHSAMENDVPGLDGPEREVGLPVQKFRVQEDSCSLVDDF